MRSNTALLIDLQDVQRIHVVGNEEVHALNGVSLQIGSGERTAIVGPSGSGKSSLMNLLGLLDRPTLGSYRFNGQDVKRFTSSERAQARNRDIGFVFQQAHLLPNLTAVDNVGLPLHYRGMSLSEIRDSSFEALDAVGLAARMRHRPGQLSGGERQRVAIARAMVSSPRLLLADEPTGALDSQNGLRILELIEALSLSRGLTVVMITHDAQLAARFPRCVHMKDGKIIADNATITFQRTIGEIAS